MTEDIPDAATAHGDPRPELGMDPDELFGDDVDDLRNSLSSLSQLAMTSLTLPQTLTHIAEFAVNAIPGADGAGLTLLDGDRRNTVVASDDFVVAVDSIQYSLGEGPCITAAERAQTVRSGSLGGGRSVAAFRAPGRQTRRTQCSVASAQDGGRGARRDERICPRQECIR